MKPIGLLIFDLDGTLVDTLEDITASLNHTLARLNRQPLETSVVRQYVGNGLTMLIERALGGRAEGIAEAVSIFKEHHHQNFIVRSRLYPSVKETLEYF